VNVKGLFSFAAENTAAAEAWWGRKLKRPCSELNRYRVFDYAV
jgi:hypothetical protein